MAETRGYTLTPESATPDKQMNQIHNERIKLLATALNNLGVGAVLAGIVAPLVSGVAGDLAHIVVWLALGADLIALAQAALGKLRP